MNTLKKICSGLFVSTLLTACSTSITRDGPPTRRIDVSRIPPVKVVPLAKSRYGNPKSYRVFGRTYHVLSSSRGYKRRGIASWYGKKFHGRLTSTRERYNMYALTAASTELPIPCYVRVTNLKNHRSLIVKVNDRGPFADNRIIDLSYAAAKKLGIVRKGTGYVEVTALDMRQPERKPLSLNLYAQVGAFQSRRTAQNTLSMLKRTESFHRGEINVATINGHRWYRVWLGPIPTISQSDRLLDQLRSHGYVAFTVIH